MQPTADGSTAGGRRRYSAWHILRVLAIGLVAGRVLMLLVPGTLPWLFITGAGVAAVVLVTTIVLLGGEPSLNSHQPGRP